MQHTTIAVDVAKSVFEVAVSQRPGRVAERRRLSRGQFARFLSERAPATVVMEACGTAHFWGREAKARGHEVVLLPPHAVRPYVLRNKTDGADAKGLLEAIRNESIRAVPVKSVDQHVLASLHPAALGVDGDAYRAAQHGAGSLARARLRHPGGCAPGRAASRGSRLGRRLGTSRCAPPVLAEAAREIRELEVRIRQVARSLEGMAGASDGVKRLRTIPGVGLLSATALAAFVGDVQRFPSGRHFASYLGLTPRESSSGLRRRLGAISKRGDPYLRMLLIHGARSVLLHAKKATGQRDRLRTWALERERARGHNKAAVALANKLARVVWAVSRNERPYGATTERSRD